MAIEYTEEKRFTVEQVSAVQVGRLGIGAVAGTVVQGIAAFGYGDQRMGWRPFGRLGSRARRYRNGGLYALGAGRSGISRAAYRQPSR